MLLSVVQIAGQGTGVHDLPAVCAILAAAYVNEQLLQVDATRNQIHRMIMDRLRWT